MAPIATSTSKPKLPEIPTDRAVWNSNPTWDKIFANGERLTYFERRLVYLSSHFPEKFTEAGQFKAKDETSLSSWELELVRAGRTFPVALENNRVHNRYFETSRSLPQQHTPEEPSPALFSLPRLPTDRSPWFLDPISGDVLANGETLTTFERRLANLATVHPYLFHSTGDFISRAEPHLTSLERDLVRTARLFPLNLKGVKGFGSHDTDGSLKPSSAPERLVRPADSAGTTKPSEQEQTADEPSTNANMSSRKYWDKKVPTHQRMVPPPPTGYGICENFR